MPSSTLPLLKPRIDIPPGTNFYAYNPSHVAPVIFAVLIFISLSLHIYQNLHYRFWRITFFAFWAGAVFTTGWILRTISTYNPTIFNLFIAQYVFIYAGPPIYAAVEYNVLGRLMHYLPMYAPLHPGRVLITFVYLGAAVESFTAAGARLAADLQFEPSVRRTGGVLMAISVLLQVFVEILFISMVYLMQRRCQKGGTFPPNVRKLCITLYGTSSLIVIRCIFRAVEAFAQYTATTCDGICYTLATHEWFLYIFDALPVLVFTYWLNVMHPGRFIPRHAKQYLDVDGMTERIGPGWIDRRSKLQTWLDPVDLGGRVKGNPAHEKFWETPEKWEAVGEGKSFARGTGSNVGKTG